MNATSPKPPGVERPEDQFLALEGAAQVLDKGFFMALVFSMQIAIVAPRGGIGEPTGNRRPRAGSRVHSSPEGRTPCLVDWPLNGNRIHRARTSKAGELQVDLETETPNLLRLEKHGTDAWQPTPAAFVWKLRPGANVLRVRSVNQWQRLGQESHVEVTYAPER